MQRARKAGLTIIGSGDDDELTGSRWADYLGGGLGDDMIHGRSGDDRIWGEEGNDRMFGEGGSDEFRASSGNDTADGGSGTDKLSFFNADGVDLDVSSGTAAYTVASVAGTLTFTSIEIVEASDGDDVILCGDQGLRVYAREGDDHVTGGAGDDWIDLSWGNNTASGGVGDDTFSVGLGEDILDGGEGVDELFFAHLESGVTAAVDAASIGVQFGEDAASVHITNFENLRGSDMDDALAGDGNANRLLGEGGDDMLTGLGGDDYLGGGDGHDDLTGGEGRDTFIFSGKNARYSEDQIYDFDVNEDRLLFDSKLYTALRRVGGTEEGGGYVFRSLKADQFQSTDQRHALNKDIRLMHDADSGRLYYDPDGSGKARAELVTYIEKDISLTAADIFVM